MPTTDAEGLRTRLAAEGVLTRSGAEWRTTRRWQAAMMRGASKLVANEPGGEDLRIPVAMALVELCGDQFTDEQLVDFVEVVLPIEARELSPPSPGG